MKLIGISGVQGAGKSSVLNELMNRGVPVDGFKVSRAVQAQLGWASLDNVMSSPATMMVFQREVFNQKYANDKRLAQAGEIPYSLPQFYLTERTFVDICAYTTLWTHKFVHRSELSIEDAFSFLLPYTQDCANAQAELYSGLVLLPLMDHIPVDDDPNRAKREDAEGIWNNIELFVQRKLPITAKTLTLSTKTVAERADQVELFLRSF